MSLEQSQLQGFVFQVDFCMHAHTLAPRRTRDHSKLCRYVQCMHAACSGLQRTVVYVALGTDASGVFEEIGRHTAQARELMKEYCIGTLKH